MYHFVENKVLTFYIWVLYDGVVDDMKPITYITLYVVPRIHLFKNFEVKHTEFMKILKKDLNESRTGDNKIITKG